MNSLLAKHRAAVTPMKPKKGADVGQVSYDTVAIVGSNWIRSMNIVRLCGRCLCYETPKRKTYPLTSCALGRGRHRGDMEPDYSMSLRARLDCGVRRPTM